MKKMKRRMRNFAQEGMDALDDQLDAGFSDAEGSIKERLNRMTSQIKEGAVKSTNDNETEGILNFTPDQRSLSSLSTLLFGLFVLTVLPGMFKTIASIFIAAGAIMFYRSYINRCKVDMSDGYVGTIYKWGTPIDKKPKKGRNWFLSLQYFLPFQVSTRDQVTSTSCSGVTSDFGTMQMDGQNVWRIVDDKKFNETTTPDGVIKLIRLYSRYIAIRIITSMDSRVKFVGTQNMDNIKAALNKYLEPYGVEVIRVNLPRINNPIIEDLERIRTDLVSIEQFASKSQAKKESAIKEVESTIRKAQRDSRTTSSNLAQAKVGLETVIAGELNTIVQQYMISERKDLERGKTQLLKDIKTYVAKKGKAKQILSNWAGLKVEIDLKVAALKRKALVKMMPKSVNVISVPGIGQAAILQKAADMFGSNSKSLVPATALAGVVESTQESVKSVVTDEGSESFELEKDLE